MKKVNARVVNYVTLVQCNKINIEDVPLDIKADVIEMFSFLQNGEDKEREEATNHED